MTEGKADAARKLLASGTPPREVAVTLGVSVATSIAGYLPAIAPDLGAVPGHGGIRARRLPVTS